MSVLARLRRWSALAPAERPELDVSEHPLLDRQALVEARRMMRKTMRQQARQPKWAPRRRKLTDELLALAADVDLMERAQALPRPTSAQVDAIRDEFDALSDEEKAMRLLEVLR